MAKRLTDQQKDEIIKLFTSGINIDQISQQFNCSKLTITRNLKNNLGELKYKELLVLTKSNKKSGDDQKQKIKNSNKNKINIKPKNDESNEIRNKELNNEFPQVSEFIEITPLNYDLENTIQKDFSSIPISNMLGATKGYT